MCMQFYKAIVAASKPKLHANQVTITAGILGHHIGHLLIDYMLYIHLTIKDNNH